MKNGLEIGNNGNQCAEILHKEGLLRDGLEDTEIVELARPYMIDEKHLENDDFWEDVFIRVDELGYKLKY